MYFKEIFPFLGLAISAFLTSCASIEYGRQTGNPSLGNKPCIAYEKDVLGLGVSLANEIKERLMGYNAGVRVLATEDTRECSSLIKVQPTIWKNANLGHVWVTMDSDSGSASFKFENSDRNCCHLGPKGASEKIAENLAKISGLISQ